MSEIERVALDAIEFIEDLTAAPLLDSEDAEMRLEDVQAHAGIEAASLRKRLAAALEAEASEGERRGWLSAVDALEEMAKAMDEKAESLRGPNPFDPATKDEADAAVTGWVLEQAAKLLRDRALIPEAPAQRELGSAAANQISTPEVGLPEASAREGK